MQVTAPPYTLGVTGRVLSTDDFTALAGDQVIEYGQFLDGDLVSAPIGGAHLRWIVCTGSRFVDCDFRGATFDCVFFDFCTFERCHFDDALLFESVFAGSNLRDCSFVGATADQCNFNGIVAERCDFSDASLCRSRFLGATLTAVQFINCDLKGAYLQFSDRHEVTFKHSNHYEAYL